MLLEVLIDSVLLEYNDSQMLKKNNKKNVMFFVYVENAYIRCSFQLSWKVFYLRCVLLKKYASVGMEH